MQEPQKIKEKKKDWILTNKNTSLFWLEQRTCVTLFE